MLSWQNGSNEDFVYGWWHSVEVVSVADSLEILSPSSGWNDYPLGTAETYNMGPTSDGTALLSAGKWIVRLTYGR
jgi:hypothetical protein